ncbi:MAG: response regulator transcription factor [Verrucomicrobiota bacterium]|jgi:DNA-binding NarL/FixJ family response regulator
MNASPSDIKAVVWLIEDHADSRRVLARVLNRNPTMQCPCASASCEEALAALRSQPPPDVILMGVDLPGMSGIEGIGPLKALAPGLHIIMLTVFDDQEKVFQAKG